MFSFTELQGQSKPLHQGGSIEINTNYRRGGKPAWFILLKLLGVAVMVAVGAAIVIPTLLELEFPLWEAAAITAGGMLIYTGIGFFFRPEPNTDNLGWGGGLANDPFQYADNINRFLWRLHCVLGPARFTAETLLDTCALLGLIRSDELAADAVAGGYASAGGGCSFDFTRPIAPLDPDRFAQTSAHFVTGQIQLDTQRFLSGHSQPPGGAR